MKKRKSGAYIRLFYRKRSSSFLGNVYKASITGDEEDIHGIRTDGKKIFTLCRLFGKLDAGARKKLKRGRVFRPLYRRAGSIREIQVNRRLLMSLQLPLTFDSFSGWLEREELEAFRKFLRLVGKYDEAGSACMERQIRKICRKNPGGKPIRAMKEFIRITSGKISRLLSGSPEERDLHRIRQQLKALSAIAVILHAVSPAAETEQFIGRVNAAEMLIGDWHDRVVLRDSIDRYRKQCAGLPKEEAEALDLLDRELTDQREALARRFMPEVDEIVRMVQEERICG